MQDRSEVCLCILCLMDGTFYIEIHSRAVRLVRSNRRFDFTLQNHYCDPSVSFPCCKKIAHLDEKACYCWRTVCLVAGLVLHAPRFSLDCFTDDSGWLLKVVPVTFMI